MFRSFSGLRDDDAALMESPPLAILTFPHEGKFAGIFFWILDRG
jgi:hypothetical protein